jgi:hypothetical protein
MQMSSLSEYTVQVRGPKEDREQFAALIEAAAWGQSRDGDIAIPFASVISDWHDTDEYRTFWITPGDDGCLFQRDGGSLVFRGQSRNTPPVRFLLRISEQLPTVSFGIESVTEHTMCEKWVVQKGRAKLIEAVEEPLREPEVWFVKDGRRVRPLPRWIDQSYPLNE